MENKKRLYAQIILKKCLKLDSNQPLVIRGTYENYDIIRLVYEEALKIGSKDIYLDVYDSYITKALYENLTEEELLENKYFSREKYEEYAKKDAAFLMLSTETPGIMDNIDPNIISSIRNHISKTCEHFDQRRDKNELSWCIAVAPTKIWADKIFPGKENSLEMLWEKIFEINYLNESNPLEKIDKNIEEKITLCKKLNNLNLKSLKFKNSIGTDVTMDLLEDGVWCSGLTKLKNGKEVIVNYPSVEIFTSPNKYTVNGKIVSSLPLLVSGVIVEGIEVEIKEGKIVNVKSETSQEVITKLIKEDEGADYIGEIALVEDDSPINNTGILYYTTLLDENAKCHFAFGSGFSECVNTNKELTKEEKDNIGLNESKTHVDVMFGTKDLDVVGITKDNEEIKIFTNGNFSKEIKK
ncbi:MAG: aminopeptidase [bacterium]